MVDHLPRKLVAIMYADVAGYSRLTGEDEDATHRTLGEYLDLITDAVRDHRGDVMHYAGDAVLARFDAVVDAMSTAVTVQHELMVRNEDISEERRLQFRIGVNSGDVIEDRGEIYGEGVNVAARLESLADPGGICISESVRAAIGKKLGLKFEDLGEQNVKNIAEPVRAYKAVATRYDASITRETKTSPSLELPDKPSIAVMPFVNMSGDVEQEYFSDGVAEDIITDLSKFSGLFVIARNSSFVYKNRAENRQDVCRDLGVRYLLEGSVRKLGSRVRINAQLIDGRSGGHVWAERFDRNLTDVFAVQDEVRSAIVAALAPTLTGTEQYQFDRRETDNEEAYDYFLRGRREDRHDTREANAQARMLLRKAIDLDPHFSLAYSYLGRSHTLCFINRWTDCVDGFLDISADLCRKAITLDDSNAHAHFALAGANLWQRKHELAVREAETAIAISPNLAEGHAILGLTRIYMGESAKAITSLRTALRLDPHRDVCLHTIAQAYFHLEQYESALSALKRRLIRKPDSDTSRVLLAASYGHLGELDNSRTEWAKALQTNPAFSLEYKRDIYPYKNPDDFEKIVSGLRKAGLP